MISTPEDIVIKVQESVKYRTIWPPLIRHLAEQELAKQGTLKKAVKAVKNTLHQIGGAYLKRKMPFEHWTKELHQSEGLADLKLTCHKIMTHHASTRERMSYTEEMYREIFASVGPIKSIMDLGCGLNPLSLPWMSLGSDIQYDAFDIYTDQIDFINAFFQVIGCPGQAHLCDISDEPPQIKADACLILKVLPLLNHLPACNTLDVLQQLRVRWLIVSYPVASLGGHNKGMALNYAAQFEDMVREESWTFNKKIYPSELVYIIDKQGVK